MAYLALGERGSLVYHPDRICLEGCGALDPEETGEAEEEVAGEVRHCCFVPCRLQHAIVGRVLILYV